MIEIAHSGNRKARVWWGELPDTSYETGQVIEHRLSAARGPFADERLAAVELWVHLGGRCEYALLGGRFTPRPTAHLLIRVAVSAGDKRRVPWAFADGIGDEVWAGLPAEYGPAVLNGALDSETSSLLGSGELSFDRAAYGHVGSCQRAFRKLASVVVALLSRKLEAPSEQELQSLLTYPN